jgi:hypothetical protein
LERRCLCAGTHPNRPADTKRRLPDIPFGNACENAGSRVLLKVCRESEQHRHKIGKEDRNKLAAKKAKDCKVIIECSSIKEGKAKFKEKEIQPLPHRHSCRRSLGQRSSAHAFYCPP